MKLNDALVTLEKARTAALEVAIAERAYRVCAALDAESSVQRGIDRARRLLERSTAKQSVDPSPSTKKSKK